MCSGLLAAEGPCDPALGPGYFRSFAARALLQACLQACPGPRCPGFASSALPPTCPPHQPTSPTSPTHPPTCIPVRQVNIGLRVLTRPIPSRLPEIYRTLGTDYAGARRRCCMFGMQRGAAWLHCFSACEDSPAPLPACLLPCPPALPARLRCCSARSCCAAPPCSHPHRPPTFMSHMCRARAALHHPGDAEERDRAVQRLAAADHARGAAACVTRRSWVAGTEWLLVCGVPLRGQLRLVAAPRCDASCHLARAAWCPPTACVLLSSCAGGVPRHPQDTDAARPLLQHRA